MIRILLFIPVYNCAAQIQRVFSRLGNKNLQHISEILVLDNQSTDGTFAALQTLRETFNLRKLTVMRNSVNLGFGGSHKRAFQYARDNSYDYCTVLHGDDQARIDDFINELKGTAMGQRGCVFGSRFSFYSRTYNYSKVRIAGNIFFNFLATGLTRRWISDLGGSGLNIYEMSSLFAGEMPVFQNYQDDLTFHTELLLDLVRRNKAFRFSPISWHETDQISSVRLRNQTIKLFSLLRAHSFSI